MAQASRLCFFLSHEVSQILTHRFAALEEILAEGVEEGVYTAAVALAGIKGELLWQGAAGWLSRDSGSPAVTLDTIFDLASLTKPLATALAVMLLADQGRLGLDATLGDIFPEAWLPEDKRLLTIKSLLAHRAGLPAWRPFYKELLKHSTAERPALLTRLAAREPLEYPAEAATLYSDLGYFLLKAAAERICRENLDDFCRREIYRPLKLDTLGFNPRRRAGGRNIFFAATEEGLIPGRNIFGEVHDENAWAAGGVAGHAGLFGTGSDIFALLAALYRTYEGKPTGPFRPESVRLFFTPVTAGGRPLGFDAPHREPSQRAAGRCFSVNSVGHLGFTGTSFWLDLENGQMVVLLTNRVHLGRDNDKIRAFRPRFHEAASRALGCAG
ncbi:MAG: serine hydrolase domain-containing protein [Deltaproteobacteria bacterium]|nr:serine hydrolase domain-containing protein [Deltaproteobacteria bacterium]